MDGLYVVLMIEIKAKKLRTSAHLCVMILPMVVSNPREKLLKKKKKVSVLLDRVEYEKLKDFCRDHGHKQSTLISKLLRDFLASEERKERGAPW